MNKNNRFSNALDSLPCPGGNGYHPRLLGVANIGIRAGLPPSDVAAAIRAHTPAGGRRVLDREIADAVAKAQRNDEPLRRSGTVVHRWRNPQPDVRPFDAAAFMRRLLAEAEGIDEADVWEASPLRIDWSPEQDAVELLAHLYDPSDILFIGDQYGLMVKPVTDWLEDFRSGQPIPPHIIPNPLTGREGPTKNGKLSFRADTCVKAFRFAMAEFDGLSRDDQMQFWWAVNLPVVALIDSGGKSLHAWILIDDVTTAERWDDMVEGKLFGNYLVPLGVDSACKNEARLSRMPGHFRAEKKRWQRILYLAPGGRKIKP